MSSSGRERWLVVAALAMAVGLLAASLVIGILWFTATGNRERISQDRLRMSALEAQVRSLGAIPVTQAPIVLVVPPTTMATTTTTVPFPPSTLAPAMTAPANPPASAAQAPAPAPQPSTTTTTPPPPPTTTPPATAPCTSLPVVGCVTRASRSATRSTELDWEALRQCENGGSYTSNPGDYYRGAYQFSYATWASVGGEGDPADASPDEQDMRALMLYERSGAGQWPVCGRRL